MNIGIDFDNTIARYDSLFQKVAKMNGFIPENWKGDNKKEATLFDIADDLSYKSYTNYTLKHFKERISQYNEQQFKYSMFHIRI